MVGGAGWGGMWQNGAAGAGGGGVVVFWKQSKENETEVLDGQEQRDLRAGWNGCPGFGSQQVRFLRTG